MKIAEMLESPSQFISGCLSLILIASIVFLCQNLPSLAINVTSLAVMLRLMTLVHLMFPYSHDGTLMFVCSLSLDPSDLLISPT